MRRRAFSAAVFAGPDHEVTGRRQWRIVFALVVMLAGRASSAQASIQYVYDDLGRLIAVVDTAGDTAVYHYDAVGNVLSIDRHASSQTSIISFSPGAGPIGTTVTIYGTGFSATPSQDAVTFHGTAATVTSATTTKLVVTVPAGATTGSIGVTAPAGSATSASSFTVATSTAPTITSFTPTIGAAGTGVTIAGTNFDTIAANNRVKFNTTVPTVSTASATSITTAVPPAAGSGPITIATPTGTVVAATDFFVPPAPFTASDVALTDRMSIGGTKVAAIGTANRIGLVTFSAVAGQRVSLLGTGGTFGGAFLSILTPNNNTLATMWVYASAYMDVKTLPTTGTYTILVDPDGSGTGNVTLNLYDVPADVAGTITPGGAPVTVTTTAPGQNGALTFSGSAGQRVSLLGSGGTYGSGVFLNLVKPDNTVIGGMPVYGSNFLDVMTLPTAGTYRIVVDPISEGTGSVTMTLYDVPADVTGTITPGGAPVTVTTTVPGQNGTLTFSGSAGQRVSLLGTGGTYGSGAWLNLVKADDSVIGSMAVYGSNFLDVMTLPTAGTYRVVIDPMSAGTGSVTMTLYDVPADVAGTITPGGAPVTVTTTVPGQNGALTFSGSAGQRVSLLGTGGTYGSGAWLNLVKPDNSVIGSMPVYGSNFLDVMTLPTAGTYRIVIDPMSAGTGSVTVTLYDVPADTSGTVAINGSSTSVTLSVPGQNGTLTFSGTASQQVTVHVTGNTMSFALIRLLSTDGVSILTQTYWLGSFDLSTVTLPSTGTYTIRVDPDGANTGVLSIGVTSP